MLGNDVGTNSVGDADTVGTVVGVPVGAGVPVVGAKLFDGAADTDGMPEGAALGLVVGESVVGPGVGESVRTGIVFGQVASEARMSHSPSQRPP